MIRVRVGKVKLLVLPRNVHLEGYGSEDYHHEVYLLLAKKKN